MVLVALCGSTGRQKSGMPMAVISACKHRALCELGGSRCCACAEHRASSSTTTPRPQPLTPCPLRVAEVAASYCPSCRHRLIERAKKAAAVLSAEFAQWRKCPQVNRQRSANFANFVLRFRLPFELVQTVLSFLLACAPCSMFSSYDRPAMRVPTAQELLREPRAATLTHYSSGSSACESRSHRGCEHNFCQLTARARIGCCACLDDRKFKNFDLVYIDGHGDTVVPVEHYAYYCSGCRVHYSQASSGNSQILFT